MRDVIQTQLMGSTNRTSPVPAVPHRITQTINNISDFFRPRIPLHRNETMRTTTTNTTTNTTPTTTTINPQTPTSVPITNHRTILIPIQVIMESPSIMPTVQRAPTIQDLEPEPSPHSQTETSTMTPRGQLQQAQTLWAEMFRTTSEAIVAPADGNRPIILSLENQKANAAWGDVLNEKPQTITRVYGMNVNGLCLDQRGGQLDVLCKVIKEVQADVFCGQEHNLSSDNTKVRQILYQTARQHWKRSRLTFGTTPITFPKQYKPGGTFMIAAGDLIGRVIAQNQDKWGRWVNQTYQGRGDTKISIYSAYQVVAKDIKIGSITTASQQQSLLMQTQDPLINPRSAFRRDLTIALQASINSGHEILLLGDFNEAFGADVDGMIRMANTCGLQDLMCIRHSSLPPATYARGFTRLDYALATAHVAASLSKAGYEPFNSKFPSDHRAYFLSSKTNYIG